MALRDRFSRKARDQKLAETVAEAVKAGLAGSPMGTTNYNRATPAEPYSTVGGQGIVTGIGQAIPMERPGVTPGGGGFGAMLGPAAPLLPAPIDAVLDETGRALPRKYEYQVATNLNLTQQEVPYGVLKSLAEQCDIIHRAIEIRVGDLIKQDWSFDLSESAVAQIMQDNNCSHAKASRLGREMYGDEINRLTAFWKNPYVQSDRSWSEWLTEALWQVFVYDQLCVYPRYNFGGDIIGFDVIDAPTIKILLDNRGDVPHPPLPAYQQVLWGFPRGEFVASPESDGDFYNSPGKYGEYKTDQLSVFIKNRRTWSPYGYSPVEEAIPAASLYLDRQAWMRAEYQFGSMPTTFMKTNSMELTLEKLSAYERILNDRLTGSTAERHRIKVLPDGFDPVAMPSQDERYKSDYDEFIIKRIAAIFGVTPSSLGVVARAGLGGGKGAHDGEAESSEAVSTRPMENYVTDIINSLGRRYLDADLNVTFVMQDRANAETQKEQAQALQISLFSGQKTLNDVQGELGQALYEMPEADEPFIVAGNAIQFLKGLLDTSSTGETIGQKETPSESDAQSTQGQEGQSEEGSDKSKPEETSVKPEASVSDEIKAFNKYVSARLRKGGSFRDFQFKTINEDDAWCFNQDVQAIIKGETYTPPKGVQAAAQRALDWIADGKAGSGFTDVGRKRASDLARGAGISMATVRRMKAYFDRHQSDKDATGFSSGEEGYPSPGRVAWDAWGGDAGYSWVRGLAGEDKAANADDTPKAGLTTKAETPAMVARRRLVANYYSPRVHSAIQSAVSGIESAVRHAMTMATAKSTDPDKNNAKASVQNNVKFDKKKLAEELLAIHAEAGLVGTVDALAQLGDVASETPIAGLANTIDWSAWTPGDPKAAEKVAGKSLKALLDNSGITIKGVADTTLEHIGNTIADGLRTGATMDEITQAIYSNWAFDYDRAAMIAATETARAANAATLDSYESSGITQWNWETYDPCDACQEQESDNPHDLGDETPPLHPNCECYMQPSLD